MIDRVHVVGAGLAGLSAALALTRGGMPVTIHEAAPQAGGRCRSYYDPQLGVNIDNGNHLVLSGNRAVAAYLDEIGTRGLLHGPATSDFGFCDLATNGRYTVRLNDGLVPWWIFRADRRVPGATLSEHVALARLLAGGNRRIDTRIRCAGALYERFVRPVMIASLNIEPAGASAALAAAVMRETLARGGAACRPLVATKGLGATFIEPALDVLRRRGAKIQFGHRLQAIKADAMRSTRLVFPDGDVKLDDAAVVLAVPPHVAAELLPGLEVPDEFTPILNVHFAYPPPADAPALLGLLNATSEWIFTFDGRLSVTVSAADRLMNEPREALAARIWQEVARALRIAAPLPPWQIVKEKRATFAATPAQDARRPRATATSLHNLVLAGDWTATGLPATIEGALRSGKTAARAIRALH